MTILPGSLDYLYYNGILERIPYEAYEIIPASPSAGMMQNNIGLGNIKQSVLGNSGMQMQNSQNSNYVNTSMKGQNYGYYGNSYGSYYGSFNNQQIGMQPQMQMYGGGYSGGLNSSAAIGAYSTSNNVGYNGDNQGIDQNEEFRFKNSIKEQAKGLKEGVLNSHPLAKGLISAAIIIATPILLIRKLRKPPIPK